MNYSTPTKGTATTIEQKNVFALFCDVFCTKLEQCEYASNIFKLVDGEKTYIAVINYSLLPNSFEINLPKEKCFVKNLFTGKSEVKSGEKMTVVLSGSDSIIYEIT